MRHFLANILTYAIALLLFLGAAGFAWVRSAQFLLTDEASVLAQYQPEPDEEFRWRPLGRSGYERNCSNCHGADGQGWDQYPPLHTAAAWLELPGGRDYLIDLHLYGLSSPRWGAPMPPMGHIHDVELAAVINYTVQAFAPEPVDPRLLLQPGDIAERRGLALSPNRQRGP